MKLVGTDEHGFPMIFEAAILNVGKHGREFDENSCAVEGVGYDATENFRIISVKRAKNGVYYGLTKQEALTILEAATKSEIVDLREIGDFHVHRSGTIKTVFIMNDYDEWSDEEVPLLVKIAKED